jgi:hypothetical protein
MADRRRGDVQLVGRLVDAAEAGNNFEGDDSFERRQVHRGYRKNSTPPEAS